MTGLTDAREFPRRAHQPALHADVHITEQAERIDVLEAEVGRLRAALAKAASAAA